MINRLYERPSIFKKGSIMKILKLRNHRELADSAAKWFHEKWGVPLEAYTESIQTCLEKNAPVPQWYIALENNQIVGGLGVIDHDFHNRKDLSPNVCAVYVEEAHRCQGIAGSLLGLACCDMQQMGIDTLYLITNHTSFYERYHWEYLCMVQNEGEPSLSRMYIHKAPKKNG